MQIKTFKISCILFACAFAYTTVVHAVSPALNSPRINDKVTIHVLGHEPRWIDTLCYSPDLRNLAVQSESTMQVWAPAPSDSLSTMTITQDREVMNIIGVEGRFSLMSDIKPGMTRYYEQPCLYAVPDSLSSCDYTAQGNVSSNGNYKTHGQMSQQLVENLKIVLDDGDTIKNVECLCTDTEAEIVYNAVDTCSHHALTRDWYAPGYRYPLLSEASDVILSFSGDTIDTKTTWSAILPSVQEEEITDDPTNEYIRSLIANENSEDEAFEHIRQIKKSDSQPTSHRNIRISDDGNAIEITLYVNDPQFADVILCDISGRIYYAKSWVEGQQTLQIPISALTPGQYLLHIATESEPVVYKLTKI